MERIKQGNSMLRNDVHPAYMFNSTTLCKYVPVPRQEPEIKQLSFVFVLHISVYFFVYEIRPSVLLFELYEVVMSGPFIGDYTVWAMLIVEGRTVNYS